MGEDLDSKFSYLIMRDPDDALVCDVSARDPKEALGRRRVS
jgi:hypothetical protein